MKLSTTLALTTLLVLPACDDKETKTRPDLKAPAKSASQSKGKAPGKAVADAKPPAPSGRVFFVKPADGAKVPEQFEVEFGVEGRQVRPAGATERDEKFGHHHLLIDTGPIDDMVIVPKDETHLHYGDGATKTTVKLSPGRHTITMQFADGAHRSYGPPWASSITVEVVAGEEAAADGAKADG
ncbi:MAG: DUF4399 domain-containing protein [Deltaproteobacteria bacterium]|nr:DUF4399 domain-containing protein [Deltaproteobacteria bacterium]